jgi:hypothetical protein
MATDVIPSEDDAYQPLIASRRGQNRGDASGTSIVRYQELSAADASNDAAERRRSPGCRFNTTVIDIAILPGPSNCPRCGAVTLVAHLT